MDLSKIAIGVLATTAVGGAAYAMLYPYLSQSRRAQQRQKMLVGTGPRTSEARDTAANSAARREKITNNLKKIETRQKQVNKLTLERRIGQAGLSWDKKKFYTVSLVCGLI